MAMFHSDIANVGGLVIGTRCPLLLRLSLLLAAAVMSAGNYGPASDLSPMTSLNRIPIGLLFSTNGDDVKNVFVHEMDKHNNNSLTVLKFFKHVKSADITDSFEVYKSICGMISQGIFALFGVANETTRPVVDAIAKTMHMPFVTISVPINTTVTKPSITSAGDILGGAVSNPTAFRWQSSTPGDVGPVGVRPLSAPSSFASNAPPSHAFAASSVTDTAEFAIYLRPMYDRAMVDVILRYKWQNVSYVYDSNDGLSRLEHLYRVVHTRHIPMEIDAVRLADVSYSYMTLRQIDANRPYGNKYIVLDLSTEDAVQTVLKQIQAVGMNRAGYHYLIGSLSLDEIDLSDFIHGGVNITGFSLIDPTLPKVQAVTKEWMKSNPKYWHAATSSKELRMEAALTIDAASVIFNGIGTLMASPESAEIHRSFKRGVVYNNGSRGIQCRTDPLVPWLHGAAILKSMLKVQFQGVTGNVAFDERGYRKNYKLDVHELNLNNPIRKIGVWDYESGLLLKDAHEETKPTKAPFVNRTRIVTSILSPPYLMTRTARAGDVTPLVGNDRFEGYCAEITAEIAKKLRNEGHSFEYELRIVRDSKYGAKEQDGTWNGMVGELTRKEADLAIAPLTINAMRERVIDFTKPFMQLGISIMIKKPEKQKPGVFSFMDPLSYKIWMCIVISYLGVSFVLFLVSRFSPYEWQIEDNEDGPTFTNDFTMLNSLWFSLGAFMRQGIDISPRSLSGRIVGSAWWFFTLIIISSYTANLAAFLTVERMLTPIENADDLSKQREIQYGTLSSGSSFDFFKNSKITVYERMWEFMHNNPGVFVASTDEGVARVRNSKGKYAFLLESTMNDYYNQKKPCNTMKVGGDLDSKGYGIATPIGSDLREPIGLIVLELLENGFLQKLHKKWWFDKGECVPEDSKGGSSQSALTLSNVAGIFYILIGGLGLSMVVSLLEYLYKSKKSIIKHKKTFDESTRTKARQSMTSVPERENGGYTYTAPTQVSGLESFDDAKNTHTQV